MRADLSQHSGAFRDRLLPCSRRVETMMLCVQRYDLLLIMTEFIDNKLQHFSAKPRKNCP